MARQPSQRARPKATETSELAESYHRWRASRLGRITDALEERVILDLLDPVEGLRVLDVGCGDGLLACALARRGARVAGVDADPRMLASARRRAAAESVDLELAAGPAEALPFADASFDRVVGVAVLCFIGKRIAPSARWRACSSPAVVS